MEGINYFREVVKKYLDERAQSDELFAVSYNNADKNIEDCLTFILNEVKNIGRKGFADEEIYSIAMHYYDESDIIIGDRPQGTVVVNQPIELTEEEKETARKAAIIRVENEIYAEMKKKREKAVLKQKESTTIQTSLF